MEYTQTPPPVLNKYFEQRREKHDNYQEQVLGKEKMKELAKLWKKHGQDLEYIREILEYQFILEYYPDREKAKLIHDVFIRQNLFLSQCLENMSVDNELRRIAEEKKDIEI